MDDLDALFNWNTDNYNVKIKNFGNNKQIIVYSKPVVVGFASPNKGKKLKDIVKKTNTIDEFRQKAVHSIYCSSKRSKNKIYDCTRTNEWEWFITLTFDPEKVNSKDYAECTKKLSKWLNNTRNRYCKDMKYIFVPELHKSGRYHFHGLMSNCGGLEFVDSGHTDKKSGRKIYNVGKYKLGFTTATQVTSTKAVNKYIAKYVTKELAASIKGKRRYWKSKNCNMPELDYYFNEKETHMDLHGDLIRRPDFTFAQEKEYIDRNGKNQYVRYYEFQKGEDKNVEERDVIEV